MDMPIDNHTDFMQHVWDLEKQNAQLRAALEKLFQAYQMLDNDTMPEGALPLEQTQDIMPEIEQALAAAKPHENMGEPDHG